MKITIEINEEESKVYIENDLPIDQYIKVYHRITSTDEFVRKLGQKIKHAARLQLEREFDNE